METIKITLESLYDILRNEKKREDLQKLEQTFFTDVVSYLKEKQILLETTQNSENPFALGEKEKLDYEIRSIQRILKEIYEKREKKIIDIALNRSRTGSDIIDTSSMLIEERIFYEKILDILNIHRRGVLLRLLKADYPDLSLFPTTISQKQSLSSTEIEQEELPADGKVKIRIIHPVPSFIWKDLKVYGPYDSNDVTEIYAEVAGLLIRKGRAQKM